MAVKEVMRIQELNRVVVGKQVKMLTEFKGLLKEKINHDTQNK
jgi:hypothetical protein